MATYIDDVIESIKIIDKPAESDKNFDKNNTDPSSSWCPYKIFNIGNSQPTPLMNYIEEIENSLKIKAKLIFCQCKWVMLNQLLLIRQNWKSG